MVPVSPCLDLAVCVMLAGDGPSAIPIRLNVGDAAPSERRWRRALAARRLILVPGRTLPAHHVQSSRNVSASVS